MIRFVCLGTQIMCDGATEHFAFYDTVVSQFVNGWDGQSQAFDVDGLADELRTEQSPIRQKRTVDALLSMMPPDLRREVEESLKKPKEMEQ